MIESTHTVFDIITSHKDSILSLYVDTVEFFVRRTEE